MRAKNLAGLYDLKTLEWAPVAQRLAVGFTQAPGTGGPNRHSSWLSTVDEDGAPHVHGLGVLWHRDAFWFETGEHSVKGRNLAREPRCALSLALAEYDLAFQGVAEPVRDPDAVRELAALWAEGGWPCEPDETGTALTAPFSAPSAGSPPWLVYRFTITKATVLSVVGDGGATTFDF
ncbi:pyridoxamine 5'-phosphate oxidase family protein [Spongisporangium articulatum]|uniref:Pyridoxamine 5'-phosphate oxidase family protein n=1 Tax=Spongisporangium articulatum TaxID=3362603 RepID=A0ABW8AQA1_9ACTN